VRCVVSVSMLTEGWDANTVTHILGVRAFGTQLLCEQVVGRALRRVNYDPDDDGMFEPEYADVLGVPFTFVASHKIAAPRPPRPLTRVHALPEREALEIRFPRVVGYRVTLPSELLKAKFTEDSRLVISPDDIPTRAENEGIVGEGVTLTLEEIGKRRLREVEFHVAGHALRSRFRDDEGNLKPYLFPQLLRITREWLGRGYLVCKGDTRMQYLLWRHFADLAVDRIYRAVTGDIEGEERLRPIIDSYNPWGSSRYVDLTTSKNALWPTHADRSQVNYVVYDSEWEANFCEQVERMPEVAAYVKNHGLGFEVPYLHGGEEHRYRPDFILRIADAADDPLHLIVEIKGYRQGDAQAKADTMRSLWVPAVNNHGQLGRWAFLEIRDIYEAAKEIRAWLDGNHPGMPA
jgi:type III restriction enzyme